MSKIILKPTYTEEVDMNVAPCRRCDGVARTLSTRIMPDVRCWQVECEVCGNKADMHTQKHIAREFWNTANKVENYL